MVYTDKTLAGALFFFASVQAMLLMIISGCLYPGYCISSNYISDLGVGSTSLFFNSAMIILGVSTLIGTYFVHREFSYRLFTVLLILTGIGAIGVGVFPEDFGLIHGIAALMAFFFGGLSAISSYKLVRSPLNYFSIILGLISVVALVLFMTGTYLGLGPGGMERIVAYPILLWGVSFGGALMGSIR
jgi:hypothetical membrane protein